VLDPGPSLIEAAPFIRRFAGQQVVIKLGGELFDRGAVIERIVPQIATLFHCGLRPILVHGGGRQIDEACSRRGLQIVKHGGRRVTTRAVLQVVIDVVAGQLNQTFCRLLSQANVPARGFAAAVSTAIRCQRRPPRVIDGRSVDFGEVGDVEAVAVDDLLGPASERYVVPVLPSIGTLADGSQVNVNADSVAARVAVALRAQKLVMLSRVPGVMEHLDADGPISQLTMRQTRELKASDRVIGGMRAKLEEALRALDGGVSQVHIISGIEPNTLLREIFTEEGCGTLITGGAT